MHFVRNNAQKWAKLGALFERAGCVENRFRWIRQQDPISILLLRRQFFFAWIHQNLINRPMRKYINPSNRTSLKEFPLSVFICTWVWGRTCTFEERSDHRVQISYPTLVCSKRPKKRIRAQHHDLTNATRACKHLRKFWREDQSKQTNICISYATGFRSQM